VLGSDNSKERLTEDPNRKALTDSIMVVTYNPDTYQTVLTSIPRDTTVDYTCSTISGKVNEIYAAFGMDCLKSSIENFLKIPPIDYHIMVDFEQFTGLIDNVGTIPVTSTKTFCEQDSTSKANEYCFKSGQTYDMDGEMALAYSRNRHIDDDYERGLRQQQVITATIKKYLAEGLTFESITSLYATVDTNMPIVAVYNYYEVAKAQSSNIQSLADHNMEALVNIPSSV